MCMLQIVLMDLLKVHFDVDPDNVQTIIATILLPWAFKLIYGMLVDSVPICGSRKRSYIVLMGFLQFAVSTVGSLINKSVSIEGFFIGSLVLVTAFAISDTALDAMMVQQSRLDPVNGSENL